MSINEVNESNINKVICSNCTKEMSFINEIQSIYDKDLYTQKWNCKNCKYNIDIEINECR